MFVDSTAVNEVEFSPKAPRASGRSTASARNSKQSKEFGAPRSSSEDIRDSIEAMERMKEAMDAGTHINFLDSLSSSGRAAIRRKFSSIFHR